MVIKLLVGYVVTFNARSNIAKYTQAELLFSKK